MKTTIDMLIILKNVLMWMWWTRIPIINVPDCPTKCAFMDPLIQY